MVFASLKLQYWRQLKPKHVGAFIVIFSINFNILKKFKCALFGQIKDLINFTLFISSLKEQIFLPILSQMNLIQTLTSFL
jgi:hypothetical protein